MDFGCEELKLLLSVAKKDEIENYTNHLKHVISNYEDFGDMKSEKEYRKYLDAAIKIECVKNACLS